MDGITVLSSTKKMPFLSEPRYLKYKGFLIADTAAPYYELLYLPLKESSPVPKFKECAKKGEIEEQGMVLYYTNQCPHTDKYAPMLQKIANEHGVDFKLCKMETTQQAQNAPCPFTTYSFFNEGKFVTNEILSEAKFMKFLNAHGII